MKVLFKNIFLVIGVIPFLSCSDVNFIEGTEHFACEDLENINNILLVTSEYDEKYDINTDGKITVEDKIIIENSLLEDNASCVNRMTQHSTCDDASIIMEELDNWTTFKYLSFSKIKEAIAYSIIYYETGVSCGPSPSFVGDVNMNGYLDCGDHRDVKTFVGSDYSVKLTLRSEGFNLNLADPNNSAYVPDYDENGDPILDGNGDVIEIPNVNSVDVALIKGAVDYLLENYAAYLGSCPNI